MSKYESATSYFNTPEDRARCESIVDLVDPAVPNREVAILDIGCSTGALLHAFKRRGYEAVEGLDPSPGCSIYARDVYGITVRTGTAAAVADLPGRYGLVILSAVLEHLVDPRQALRDVWGVMHDGALLFVEVPDVEGFAACARAPFQEFSVEHINFFSLASLTSLMGTAAFRPWIGERRRVRWLSESLAPAIYAVFRKSSTTLPPAFDSGSEAAIMAYKAACESIEAGIKAQIAELAGHGKPVLVWGVGTHTRHLLANGALDPLQVAGWVDSDPRYRGTEMRGRPVLAPSDLTARDEPILVSSGTVHHQIERQIREDLGLSNDVVLLYE
jgi:2-polyprenyl-3-methyl-5-hydroxy-6-metoxy-1,4-benzoquinol methylase